MGTGTILKLVVGIGVWMGIIVPGTVGDGYKYLSPSSSLLCSMELFSPCNNWLSQIMSVYLSVVSW